MTCKEAEKSIPMFFEEELEGKELHNFVGHIRSCKECKEELTIYFLASEGIARLEEGSSFDLDKELEARLAGQEHKMKMHRSIKTGFYFMEIILIMIILCILWYVL